jgi:hypothetical protein
MNRHFGSFLVANSPTEVNVRGSIVDRSPSHSLSDVSSRTFFLSNAVLSQHVGLGSSDRKGHLVRLGVDPEME